jgi:hypothetical protein
LLSLATLSVPALAQGTNPAVGDASSALNFVQGEATLDGQPVTTNPTSTPRPLHAGEVLATTNGTADVMLAPGALLRLGQNTAVQLVADDANRAEARIENGHANVAVNLIRPNSLLLVDMPQGQTQLLKRGLYSFDVPSETVRVYNGEADAFPGANTNTDVKPVTVKDDHEVVLSSAKLHPTKFDRTDEQADLLPWTGSQETHAAIAEGAVSYNPGYYPAAYGYPPYAYAWGFGYPYPYLAYGWPYGFYGYPYSWYGYPWFGVGLGFGYWGGGWGPWYGGRTVIGGQGLRSIYGYPGAYRGGVTAPRGFAGSGFRAGEPGGGFHGGGFAAGGFHGGGGHR